MSELAPASPALEQAGAALPKTVTLWQVFLQFLIIGATSFGGAVPYLRRALVVKLQWLDDKQFVEMLSISQSLPGLNATNMAILLGDKLRGPLGAFAAIVAICLPGGLYMFFAGVFYRIHGDHGWVTDALKGIAAASVGLILATVVQLAKRSLSDHFDLVFIGLTVLAINLLHLSVPVTLISVGLLAILWHHPRTAPAEGLGAPEELEK